MDNCSNCPFFGLKDNKKECSVWGCTRANCISNINDYTGDDDEELANLFGFETAQDMYEVMYRIKF